MDPLKNNNELIPHIPYNKALQIYSNSLPNLKHTHPPSKKVGALHTKLPYDKFYSKLYSKSKDSNSFFNTDFNDLVATPLQYLFLY